MEIMMESQGKNTDQISKRGKRVYVAPRLVRINKVVSETRYDREAKRGFVLDATGL